MEGILTPAQLRQEIANHAAWLREPGEEVARAWEATSSCRKLTAAQEREAEAASKRIRRWAWRECVKRMAGIRKNPPKPPAARANQPRASQAPPNYRPPKSGRPKPKGWKGNDAIYSDTTKPPAFVP